MRKRLAAMSFSLGLCATSGVAGSLADIEGEWNNQGGDNIRITEDQFGGWNAWLGAVGEGSIRTSSYKGSNIVVEAKKMRCWFRATVLNGTSTMNWKLVAGEGDCDSLVGYFTRTGADRRPAAFQFTICDKASYSVYIATIGRREDAPSVYLKEGWWRVDPGGCKNLGQFLRGHFYYFGHAYGDRSRQFSGGHASCVSSSSMKLDESAEHCGSADAWSARFIERYVTEGALTIDLTE